MKKKTIFICDKCSAEFSAKEDCKKHEASHKIAVGDLVYGILRKEYFIVEKLNGKMIKVNGRWRQKMFWKKVASASRLKMIKEDSIGWIKDSLGTVLLKPTFNKKNGNMVFAIEFATWL